MPIKRKADVAIEEKFGRTLEGYVHKTNSMQKRALDEQVAKFIFASNTSFRTVEHTEFLRMVGMLRPGYIPPSRNEVAGVLLDKIHEEEMAKCSKILNDQTVSLSLDGWSNVHNEPIICVTVTTENGEIYVVDSLDTSGYPHTAEYLVSVAKSSITKCENVFACAVRSVVTDNAANVTSMRSELQKDDAYDVLTYGCSAHLLNLLSQDLNIPNVKEHIVHICKYFRNNHLAAAKLREAGGPKLILPQDVRWNTIFDCLSIYLKQWATLMKVCEENREAIDKLVSTKVSNISIKRNAEDLVKRLKPIALTLDAIQKDNCSISRAVYLWKKLETELTEVLDKKEMKTFVKRYNQALDAPHFLAYLIDPRYCGENLTEGERKDALTLANDKYPFFMPVILKYLARAAPFYDFLFEEGIVSKMSPLQWWKVHFDTIQKDAKGIDAAVRQLLTATATSASVERVFSAHGLVHSTVRNRLGAEKAAKLVFLYKALNK